VERNAQQAKLPTTRRDLTKTQRLNQIEAGLLSNQYQIVIKAKSA
jgi:hypothetical protein